MEEPGSCSVSYLGFSVITCSSWRITLLGFGLRQAAHPEGCGCHHWCTSHTGCTAAAGDWNGESAEEMRAARANRAAEEAHRKEFERASAAGELTEHQILAENERVAALQRAADAASQQAEQRVLEIETKGVFPEGDLRKKRKNAIELATSIFSERRYLDKDEGDNGMTGCSETLDTVLCYTCLCIPFYFGRCWFKSLPACIKDPLTDSCRDKQFTKRNVTGMLLEEAEEPISMNIGKCFFCITGLSLFSYLCNSEDTGGACGSTHVSSASNVDVTNTVYCFKRVLTKIPHFEDEGAQMHHYGDKRETWNDLFRLLFDSYEPSVRSVHVAVAREMIKMNPDLVNAATFEDNYTILVAAIRQENIEFTTMLLEMGANPNILDKYGWTAMHHAVPFNDGMILYTDQELIVSSWIQTSPFILTLLHKISKPDLAIRTADCGSTPADFVTCRLEVLEGRATMINEAIREARLYRQEAPYTPQAVQAINQCVQTERAHLVLLMVTALPEPHIFVQGPSPPYRPEGYELSQAAIAAFQASETASSQPGGVITAQPGALPSLPALPGLPPLPAAASVTNPAFEAVVDAIVPAAAAGARSGSLPPLPGAAAPAPPALPQAPTAAAAPLPPPPATTTAAPAALPVPATTTAALALPALPQAPT
eukprot:gene19446-23734_t